MQWDMPKLMIEKIYIYGQIMRAANNGVGSFFLDGPGKTVTTILTTKIWEAVWFQNDTILPIASHAIASTLVLGEITTNSGLKFSLNMQFYETPTCNIYKTTGIGKVLLQCKCIVWNKCTMVHTKLHGLLIGYCNICLESSDHFGKYIRCRRKISCKHNQ